MKNIKPYREHRFSVQVGLNWDCKYCGCMLGGGRDRWPCPGPFTCQQGTMKNSCDEKLPTLGASCAA